MNWLRRQLMRLSATATPLAIADPSSRSGTVFIARTPELFAYDADGNMTSDGRFHYFWNGENRLVMASNDTVVVTYAYDHRGRMVRKEISHEGTKTRRIEYLWDDWNIIRETITNPSTLQPFNSSTYYIWGLDLDGTLQGAGGVGGLLAVVRDDGVFLPTYDANGNISEYVSTNGEIVAHYDYSPFGEPLVASGSFASTFTHQFSTKPYCPVTGFSEYQMRKYNPEIGRWMSRDPIEEIPLYSFCYSDAINEIDILGLQVLPDIDIPQGDEGFTEMYKAAKPKIDEYLKKHGPEGHHDHTPRGNCSPWPSVASSSYTGERVYSYKLFRWKNNSLWRFKTRKTITIPLPKVPDPLRIEKNTVIGIIGDVDAYLLVREKWIVWYCRCAFTPYQRGSGPFREYQNPGSDVVLRIDETTATTEFQDEERIPLLPFLDLFNNALLPIFQGDF